MFDQDHPGLPPQEIIRRIEKALEIDGTHTWDDVRGMLIEGKAQIFWSDHGAWITEIAIFPRKRILNVWVIAGELPEVMEIQKQVERYALTMTCDELGGRGRFGWKNVLKEHGWEAVGVGWRHKVTEEMNRE